MAPAQRFRGNAAKKTPSRSSSTVVSKGRKSHHEDKLELNPKDLNASAGRVFYERASSRRRRHRDVLMEENSASAQPLGKRGKIMSKGPHLTSSLTMRRLQDKYEVTTEEALERQGELRIAKLREQLSHAAGGVVWRTSDSTSRPGRAASALRTFQAKKMASRKPHPSRRRR